MRGVAAPWCQTCRSLDGALVSTWTSPFSALRPAPPRSSRPCASRPSSSLSPKKLEADLARTSRCASSIAHPAHGTAHLVHESFLLLSLSSALRILAGAAISLLKTIPNHFSGQAHALTAAWREQNDFLYLLRTAPITCRSHQFLLSPRRCATRAARPSGANGHETNHIKLLTTPCVPESHGHLWPWNPVTVSP